MSNAVYIRRQPVVNRQKAITATRLIVPVDTAAEAVPILESLGDVWPASRSVFVSLGDALPDEGLLGWASPENAMIEIPAETLAASPTASLVAKLAAQGTPLCLANWAPGMALSGETQFRFALADARLHPQAKNAPCLVLAEGLADHKEFAGAMDNGYSGAAGWFFLHGLPVSDKLNPGHGQIVRVINLVRRNAEVREIETALKQDVTLSFKLLRYINSVGFGLSCEIQSFRHAVTILGYDKLNKWLSLLLVTASKDPAAPALMQTAIARGRFMEIVGKSYFDKSVLDNLFITGSFSLLHVLLGAHMDKILEQMHLPDAISDALLHDQGVYAPFLDLALACESDDTASLTAQAEALQLTPGQVNRAQLEALAFADSLQFN